jgi:gas vesicle protein
VEVLVNDGIGFSTSSILVSFVVGGLAGATAGLLLAPHSGKASRGKIGGRIRDEVDRGRMAGARITGKGRELLDEASGYLGKQVEEQEQRHVRHVEASRQREKTPAV